MGCTYTDRDNDDDDEMMTQNYFTSSFYVVCNMLTLVVLDFISLLIFIVVMSRLDLARTVDILLSSMEDLNNIFVII